MDKVTVGTKVRMARMGYYNDEKHPLVGERGVVTQVQGNRLAVLFEVFPFEWAFHNAPSDRVADSIDCLDIITEEEFHEVRS